MSKLRDLAARAGRWLGLAAGQVPAAHTGAVEDDRFDEMTWRDTRTQSPALAELIDDLAEHRDYAAELIRDVFLAAFKAAPAVRDANVMDPARLANYQVVASMLASPEFASLRRHTAGDPFAAAMAVLAMADTLRAMLQRAEDAQYVAEQAAQAQRQAAQAARAVREAMDTATRQADQDGDVPADAAATFDQATDTAGDADAAADAVALEASRKLAEAGPALRAAARSAARHAAEAASEQAVLMAAWGVSPGELTRMPFAERARLAAQLAGGRLGRFADLIGRFRTMASAERARKTEHGPGELVGITLGDDLGRLIPSELATLGVPALRATFAARYAESRLFVYQTRGEAESGQGAIIACIDCSGSMSGAREAWAKACALALLDQARQAGRDFAGILFSSASHQPAVFRFPKGQGPIGQVIEFTETFFGGGTDFTTPLDTAVSLLGAEFSADGRQRGDIVLITDGICEVTEDWMRTYLDRKNTLAFRTFGVAIGREPTAVLDALCDNVRRVEDLAEPSVAAGMFRVI